MTAKEESKVEISGRKVVDSIKSAWEYLEARSFIIQWKHKKIIDFPLSWTVVITILLPRFVFLCILLALLLKCTLVIEKSK